MHFWSSYGASVTFVLAVSVLLPLVFFVYRLIWRRENLLDFGFGALAYAVSELVVRLPLLSLIGIWVTAPAAQLSTPYVIYIVFLSFSAGLAEEWARYFLIRLLVRRGRLDGVGILSFGVGHASCEALTMVGLSCLASICSPAGQQALAQSTPVDVTLVGVEQVFMYCIHIGLTFLIYTAAARAQKSRVWGAVTLHAIVSFFALLLRSTFSGNVWPAECWMFFCAIAATLYVFLRLPDTLPQKREKERG